MSMPIDIETLLNKQRIESERIEFKRGGTRLVSTARFAHSPTILKIWAAGTFLSA